MHAIKTNLLLVIVYLFVLINIPTNSSFAVVTCSTSNPSVCNDGDACTVDVCNAGKCTNQPKFCDDNNICTIDSCSNGQCLTTPTVCDDGNPNTTDICDIAMGCIFTFTCIAGTPCDDGQICTLEDTCINLGQCVGWKSKCNDDDSNTFDTCNRTTGECTHAPVVCPGTNSCDDGNLCTVNDKCSFNECKGTQKTCDDMSYLTVDICNPVTGACTNTLIRQGSNKSCMGTDPANCNDNNPCTLDICVASACFYDARHNLACDDGNPCTTQDACFINQCTGTPKVCDDQKTNTANSCNATTGECIFTPIVCQEGASCNDENPCTINDLCSNSQCTGTPKVCDDQKTNTADSCNATTGECVFTPIVCQEGAPCDDENPCTVNDLCSNTQCTGIPKTCDDQKTNTADSCNATTGECVFTPCQEGTLCEDNNPCTVNDFCSNSICTGTAKCDDANSSTKDECNQVTGECLNTPISSTNDNSSNCLNNCSKPNGRCNKKTNTCICKKTFSGNDCSQKECLKNCSGNGTCEIKTGRCLCNPGFTGKACSIQQRVCANALDCGKVQLCEEGRCLPISKDRIDCVNSNECNDNELCDAGYCVRNLTFAIKCLNSSKCKSREICDKGFCIVPSNIAKEVTCSTPEDCFAENEICDQGFCVAPP